MAGGSRAHSQSRTFLVSSALLATVVVALDCVMQRVVTDALGPDSDRHAWWLIGDDVGLEYARNTGAAFGMFQGNPELLGAVSILVCIGFVWLIHSEMHLGFWAVLAAGLLLGGAVGNMLGRLVDGYVTDYVAVGPWPRFNLADSAITVGVGIFIISLVFGAEPDRSEHGDDAAESSDGGKPEGVWQRD